MKSLVATVPSTTCRRFCNADGWNAAVGSHHDGMHTYVRNSKHKMQVWESLGCISLLLNHIPELPIGQPKLKSNDIVGEVSKKWKTMDDEMKAVVTDPLMEELVVS